MATEILRPNANGDTVQFTPMVPGEGEANWENVDEAESDGFDTLNGQTEASEEYDLYALPNHSEGSGTINKITVHYKIWNNAEGNTDKAIIKTGGTIYSGDVQNSEVEDWSVHSQIWETNPDTEIAWTWEDIDALQIGVTLNSTDADSSITQIYLEVDYTEAPSGPTTCTFILNHNNLEALEGADSGTYPINNNMVEIAISGTSYVFNPFSKTPNGDGDSYLDMVNGSTITIIVSTE